MTAKYSRSGSVRPVGLRLGARDLVPDAPDGPRPVRDRPRPLHHRPLRVRPVQSRTPTWIADERWGNIAWRTVDWLMLAFVVFHAFMGVRTVVQDYTKRRRPHGAHDARCTSAAIVIFAMGTIAVATLRSARRCSHDPRPRRPRRRRRRRRPVGRPRAGQGRRGLGRPDQALSHPLPHRRRPGRRVCRPGQPGGGPLGVAHVRHHQGWRLPGRPGRGRGARPRGHRDGDRARAHGAAVQPDARRQDRPAPVRRPHPQLRRGPGQAGLLRGRPHRPHDPADPLPAVPQGRRQVLRRVPRRGPRHRGRRPGRRAGAPRASWPTGSPTASWSRCAPRPCCSRPAGSGGCSGSRPTPTASPATASSLAYRHGVPAQDMEFYQFHPTGIVGIGILLSEAARGEGAYLLDNDGFRFMERYAPKLMELAPRDMVSRAIHQEIRAGRGIDGKDYVYLDVRHLGRKKIDEKLPDITDFVRVYQGIEPYTDPIPIQPTAHYAMGGIPTNLLDPGDPRRGQHRRARALRRGRDGLRVRPRREPPRDELARGPARVRAAGRAPDGARHPRPGVPEVADDVMEPVRARDRGDPRAAPRASARRRIRKELADVMMDDAGVYRDAVGLERARAKVAELAARYANVSVDDKGTVFNTDLLEARELGYLLDCAETMVAACINRKESRGAHSREDYPGAGRRELPDPFPRDAGRGRRGRAGLQAGHDHEVPAQAACLLGRGRRAMTVELRILRFDPERDQKPHEETLHGRGRSHGPRPGPPPQGQVRAGRDPRRSAGPAPTASAGRTPC